MRVLWNSLLLAAVSLQLCGVAVAKEVYFRDGGIIECESFWKRDGQVVVKVNRDVVLEFETAAINMPKTFRPVKHKTHKAKRKTSAATTPHATPAVTQEAAAKPATATTKSPAAPGTPGAVPVSAAAPTPAAKQAKPAPAAPVNPPATTVAAAPANPPATTGVAAPAEKEAAPSQPEATASPAPGAVLTKAELERRTRENAEMMVEALRKKNPELMKKAVEAQKSLAQQQKDSRKNMPPQPEPSWFKYFLMLIASSIFIIIAMWVIFNKAGHQGVKSIVPFYNLYTLMEISGKPGWWFALLFIPVVGFVFYLLAMLSLAGKFGRSSLFGIGLFLLPMFFFPMLAFGGSKYESPPEGLNFTFSDEPTEV